MSTIADLPEGWTRIRESTRVRWVRGGGVEAEAMWWGPWSTYAAFLKAVGGLEQEIDYGGGITVTRIVPLKFPSDSPDFDNCYAIDCELEGMGMPAEHPTEGITYSHARARVYFRSESHFNFDTNYPLVSYTFTGGAEFVTRPGTAYHFPSDNLRLNQDVGVLIPGRDWTLTFHNLPAIDEEAYDNLAGRVNSVPFTHPNGLVYNTGFIQYLGPTGSYTRTVGNVSSWTVSHRVRLRYVMHNDVMRPDGAGFEAPVDDNGDEIIPGADLNALYAA